MVQWTGLTDREQQDCRGGFTLIEAGIGIAAVIVAGIAAYFAYDSANAANVGNALELAKWKYDNDPMSLTEAERDLLGLNANMQTVSTSFAPSGGSGVMWVSYGDPGAHPPAGMFITQSDWDRYRQARGYDLDLGGGDGGGCLA